MSKYSNIFYYLFYFFKIRKQINIADRYISILGHIHFHVKKINEVMNDDKFTIIFEQADQKTGMKICIYYKNITFNFICSSKKHYFTLGIKENAADFSSKTCMSKYNFHLSIVEPFDTELLSYYYLSLKHLNQFLTEFSLQVKSIDSSIYDSFFNTTGFKQIENNTYLYRIKSLFPNEIKSEHLYTSLSNEISSQKPDKKQLKKI